MPTEFAADSDRADFADALVTELERVLERISTIRANLRKQIDLRENKEIDYWTADPIFRGLGQACEFISEARRRAGIEAYDQRRQATGQAGSLATTMED